MNLYRKNFQIILNYTKSCLQHKSPDDIISETKSVYATYYKSHDDIILEITPLVCSTRANLASNEVSTIVK